VVVVVLVGGLLLKHIIDEHLHAPILRCAWIPPLEDGARHAENLKQ